MKKLISPNRAQPHLSLGIDRSKETEAADPDNRWYWRSSLRRWSLNRSAIQCSTSAGRLDEHGPTASRSSAPRQAGEPSLLGINDAYRTIYLPVMRGHVPDVYGVFNFPERRKSKDSGPQRPRSASALPDERSLRRRLRLAAAERLLNGNAARLDRHDYHPRVFTHVRTNANHRGDRKPRSIS